MRFLYETDDENVWKLSVVAPGTKAVFLGIAGDEKFRLRHACLVTEPVMLYL